MHIFLDVSVLLLIIVTLYTCWHKGFIASVLGVAKTVMAAILTFCFGARASAWLSARVVRERVYEYVYSRFEALLGSGEQALDASHVLDELPQWLRVLLEKMNLDADSLGISDAQTIHELSLSFTEPISGFISTMLGYAAVFLISLLGLTLLAFLLGRIAKLPVIRTFDQTLGLLLGVLCAALYASAFTVLMFALLSMIEGGVESFAFHDAFERTYIYRWLYEHNVFRWIFGIA